MFKNITSKLLFLLGLAILPLFFDYQIPNILGLINHLSSILLLFTPLLFVKNKIIGAFYWFVLSFLTLTWSLTELCYLVFEKKEFNELFLKILYESNPRELIEYFKAIIPWWQLVLVLMLIFGLLATLTKFKTQTYHFAKNTKNWLLGICGFVCVLFFSSWYINKQYFGVFKNEIRAYQSLNRYYQQFDNKKLRQQKFFAQNKFGLNKSQGKNTYLLIIGESTSKHHLGIYGYFRNTTPLLSKRQDLNIYQDVISSNTSTVECLGKCLTYAENSFEPKNLSNFNIIDIANKVGFRTFWISNQNKDALYHNSITMATQNASKMVFVQKENGPNYDAQIIPELQKALKDTAQNKLIVIQLMGTHFEFNKRFPPDFNKFNDKNELLQRFKFANTDLKKQAINDYDNAVLYQDFILNSIFNNLEPLKPNENISAIYFSDHADEVYDTRDFIGHTPQANTAFLHEIPFLTWNINRNKNIFKAFQMTNFMFSLLDWMNITFDAKFKNESIFSDSFKEKPRIMGNNKPYFKSNIKP